MASITPDQRARMLKDAEARFKARGLTTSQAKRAAREALRQFIDAQNEAETKERAQQRAANS
ncbi:MAG: hypothetical protein E7H74_18615 [Escherichia coli]|nr:hypothetical protein [Escherichia coli]QVV96897.1 hypothetical protein [Kosakonia phage Kc259]